MSLTPKKYVQKFGKHFGIGLKYREIMILDHLEVSDNIDLECDIVFAPNHEYEKTHEDGWTIRAQLERDYYVWIEEFTASHPTHGDITGNLREKITATSKKALAHFMKQHPLHVFDTGDI